MPQIRQEVFSVTRACERLLSTDLTLTEDERSLLEYYIEELSREFFSGKPTVRLPFTEQLLDFHQRFHAREAWQGLTRSCISGSNMTQLEVYGTVEDTMCARPGIALDLRWRESEGRY